ncbi:MAG: hypothetical protein COY19_04905 [Candidatus Marinimicrobia bacterium CG_4_10_14_0_2_um_filter_48_9]|nr:MAG: hypothetical protein COY19_04905 [Candidatus Marinimicrobia bacterium CG_4_10_14_0_2_um_filter_48_9]
MITNAKLLIVEDDLQMQRVYQYFLSEINGLQVAFETKADAILTSVESFKPDVLILDLSLGGQSVHSLIQTFTHQSKIPQIIVLTADESVAVAVHAMRSGAFNYLVKPIEKEAFLVAVDHALEYVESIKELMHLRQRSSPEKQFPNIITHSPAMQNVLRLVGDLAKTDFSVLIQGENGTGKELIARALHQNSRRASRPFVAINCAALPDSLVESELFGYEKGAFTGAGQRHLGKFEQANGGTIFLDEIGDMGILAQSRLLRVLQESEIYRLGGNESIKVDVRVIAATNKNLKEAIQSGQFREDLYYRLSVFPVTIPPLRERREDIIDLLQYFLENYRREDQPVIHDFSHSAIELLKGYNWPGNIRELQNISRRLLLTIENEVVKADDLPMEFRPKTELAEHRTSLVTDDRLAPLTEIERDAIMRTLNYTHHQIVAAAKILGIGRSTLYRKMATYGIHLPDSEA